MKLHFLKKKRKILKDLDKLVSSIHEELKNEAISPYQKQSLLDNRNKVEDAKNRLDNFFFFAFPCVQARIYS